jgi:predicted membrane-bound mannosyltransferase
MLLKIIVPGSDYWPLPWYLRRFTSVGYWSEPPDEPDAAMIVTTPALEADLDAALSNSYRKEYFGLRPDVLLLTYIRADLWEKFLEGIEQ